jgi:small nuclear ribonucleoprotein (snRNP)-like protein
LDDSPLVLSRTIPLFSNQQVHYPLIHDFLNKHVKVKVNDGLVVEGMLIHYQMENKTLHKPSVLILKNGDSFHVLRGNFENISEAK